MTDSNTAGQAEARNRPRPVWMLLISKWRTIVVGGMLAALVGVAVAAVLPETYRSSCVLLFTPPRDSENLQLPPEQLHMTTLQSIATSYQVYQDVAKVMRGQHEILQTLLGVLPEEGGSLEDRLKRHAQTLSTTDAAALLENEPSDRFRRLWEELPPPETLGAFLHIQAKELEELDPIRLGAILNCEIRTSLENNRMVEYQPILTLSADAGSPAKAALLAHTWASSIRRTVDTHYVVPTIQRRDEVLAQIRETRAQIAEVDSRIASVRKETGLDQLFLRKEVLLERLYGGVPARFETQDRKILNATGESVQPVQSSAESDLAVQLAGYLKSASPDSLFARRNELIERFQLLSALNQSQGEKGSFPSAATIEGQATNEVSAIEKEMRALESEVRQLNREIAGARERIEILRVERDELEQRRLHRMAYGGREAESMPDLEEMRLRLLRPPVPPKARRSPHFGWVALLTWIGSTLVISTWLVYSEATRRAEQAA